MSDKRVYHTRPYFILQQVYITYCVLQLEFLTYFVLQQVFLIYFVLQRVFLTYFMCNVSRTTGNNASSLSLSMGHTPIDTISNALTNLHPPA